MKIVLSVKQQGHVPSFKTQKRAAINRQTGQAMIVTGRKEKEWMQRCIQSFESQLFCACQTIGPVTPTAPPLHCSIASSLPLDDSRQWLPELHVYVQEVRKDEEGATIIIEEIK